MIGFVGAGGTSPVPNPKQCSTNLLVSMRYVCAASKLSVHKPVGSSLGLQRDAEQAEGFDKTIIAVATAAPFVKQFPSLIGHAMHVPISIVEFITPALARILKMNHVRFHDLLGHYKRANKSP